MKTTTTVTTSKYYGTNINKQSQQIITNQNQQSMSQFISPQQMLKRLIPYSNIQKDKQNLKPLYNNNQQQQENEGNIPQKTLIISNIQQLQSQLNNIHAQIIESENLLNVRDSLYGQLDILKDQRQLIQRDIEYFQNQFNNNKEIRVNVRTNQGYKEANERLRRRMNEVREYIHKMELENRKIQENINYGNALNIEKNYRTQVNSAAWVDNAYFSEKERNMGRVDDLIARLHLKQEQGLQKVRRQQQQIERRNQFNRASFATNSANVVNSQMGARTYQGPSVGSSYGGRRFYSPQYRY